MRRLIAPALSLLVGLACVCAVAAPAARADEGRFVPWKDVKTPPLALRDLAGRQHALADYRGKVVLVNFWATWCPPCRKEMPDLATLHSEFGPRGLVILAISDEELAKVEPFVKQHSYPFPMLLDPGRKVHTLFGVDGIPKSFIYDRDGKLVGTAIDMRTKGQFLAMLAKAGLR